MNLSPRWVEVLRQAGIEAVHWSELGAADALDSDIMRHAHHNGFCVFTHDLDFSAILAASGASNPSVIQVRSEDVTPEALLEPLLKAIRHHQEALEQGALLTLDPARSRVRILPLVGHAVN